MNRYLTLLLVGFLLFNQVLSRPNPEDKEQESDYPGDEEEESNDGDDDGPDVADIIIPSEVTMLSKDEDFKIKVGDDVRFPCRFTTGHAKADADDDVVYVWRRGKDQIALSDSLLISDSRFEIIEDHTLLLRNATVNDSSTSYVCELIASADFKPRVTHRLLVEPNELNYKVVPVPNSELHVNLHEPVKFGCKTDATSKTKITISHNGNKVHIQETDDGAYVNIKDVTRHHAGYYQCLVDFNAEKPITTAVHLIVNHQPEIELDQGYEITDKGKKVKLICKVHAQPHADVHWFKEDQKVESPDFIFGKEKPAKHTLTFDFHQDEKNFGKYSCQAINNLGSDKKDIVVSGKPSKPTFLRGEVVEDGKVLSLKWKTISFTELIKYEIQYRRKGDVQWQMLSIDKEVGNDVGQDNINEYIIEGKINNLEADKYEAVCRAENKDGWSELSDVFEFKGEEKTERAENVIDPKNSSGRPVVFLSTILLTLTTLLFVITPFACL